MPAPSLTHLKKTRSFHSTEKALPLKRIDQLSIELIRFLQGKRLPIQVRFFIRKGVTHEEICNQHCIHLACPNCLFCGKRLMSNRKKYCSDECDVKYYNKFIKPGLMKEHPEWFQDED